MIKHLNIKILGRVQGVFFRRFIKEIALKTNIKGFVKNMSDKSVYIEAEGKKKDLNSFVKECKKGNAWSKVKGVEITEEDVKFFEGFVINLS